MSANELILHHFDASPFAEKVRVALGIKGVHWHSVEIPMVMPKPDLVALTGGYRKTPVMQIGADIYCDTARIAREIDQRFPGTPLFPAGKGAICEALAAWSDFTLFQPGAGLSMGTNLELPEDILSDRFAFFDFLDREKLPSLLPELFARFRSGLQRIEDMLQESSFVLGESVSWADAACYAPVWMCRGNIVGADELLQNLPALCQWERRMTALGHGTSDTLSAAQSHAVARSAKSVAVAELADDRLPRLPLNQRVLVTPEDYGAVPVSGELLRLTQHDIAVCRSDDSAGEVVVHFPRAGYRVEAV